SIDDFTKNLDKMIEKNIISDYDNNCTDDDINITIKGYPQSDFEKLYEKLNLEKTESSNNFHINHPDFNSPIKIDSVQNFLNLFYEMRLPIYEKRKIIMLQNLENEK